MTNNNSLLNTLYYKILEIDIIKDSSLSSKVFSGLIFIGIFTKFYIGSVIKTKDGSNGPATSLIWGYSIIVFSLVSMVFLNSVSGDKEDYNNLVGIMNLFPLPIIFLIILLIWEISIAFRYEKKLNKGEIPDTYLQFSYYSTIVMTFQIVVTMLHYTMNMIVKKRSVGLLPPSTSSGDVLSFLDKLSSSNFVLIFLNFILITIKQVILSNYTVDGDYGGMNNRTTINDANIRLILPDHLF